MFLEREIKNFILSEYKHHTLLIYFWFDPKKTNAISHVGNTRRVRALFFLLNFINNLHSTISSMFHFYRTINYDFLYKKCDMYIAEEKESCEE